MVGFPQSPHLKIHDPFLVRKKTPMEFVGETSPPFVGGTPLGWWGKPWLRQMLMVMGSSPRKRCQTCWRVDAWGAVLAVFFLVKDFGYGLVGRKNHGVFVCCFVFGFKKDLEHAKFYLFFCWLYISVTWKRYVFKIGPEMDLKWHAPILQFPNLTPKVEGFLDAHG